MKRTNLAIACALAATLGTASARADFTFTLDTGNSGINSYAGPYATVDVHLDSSTQATITFTSLTSGGNIYLFSDGGAVDVNVNATTFTLGSMSATTAGSTFKAPSLVNAGSGNADGLGNYNQRINNGSGYDEAVNQVTFQITNTSGTWAADTNVLTANNKGYIAAAHIYVTADPPTRSAGALTTGYAAGNDPVAPVPPSAILLGIGGIGFLGFLRWNRRGQPVAA